MSRPTWKIKGKASIVFFYFGDSYLTTLAQETTKLNNALEGYDYSVLLKHTITAGPFQVSAKAAKTADKVLKPTQAGLVKAIRDTADRGYMIDLWIFTHGNPDKFLVSTGKNGSSGKFKADEIMKQLGPAATGHKSLPIRMVYQMNCFGSTLNDTWRAIGAKVSMGARQVNFYPNQYGRFAKEWDKRSTFAEACKAADNKSSRTAVQTYLAMVDAPSTRDEWGKCPFGKTILGKHNCAKKYLTKRWTVDWRKGRSGKQNINYSSHKVISGDRKITKRSKPTWYK